MAQVDTITNEYLGRPGDLGHIKYVTDSAANDSDKTITVPAGKVWYVLNIYASLVCTAAAGNRLMALIVSDSNGTEIYRNAAVAAQIADATEFYAWLPQIGTPAETVATYHHLPFPFTYLPGGSTLRIWDNAAIAAATDDLTINMIVVEYGG